MPRMLPVDKELYAIKEYEELSASYTKMLLTTTDEYGKDYLRLLINRCDASVLHIKSLMELDKVANVFDYDTQKPLSDTQTEEANNYVTASRNYALEYLHLYGEFLMDRGCEGQLVSYYDTMIVFIDAVGAAFNKDISVNIKEEYDAPPMPDAEVL